MKKLMLSLVALIFSMTVAAGNFAMAAEGPGDEPKTEKKVEKKDKKKQKKEKKSKKSKKSKKVKKAEGEEGGK
jgi:Ni/Co efflux regulator RcnB